MTIKRQTLFGVLSIGLFLIALAVPLRAQDRDQIQRMASNLSKDARETWNAMQYARNSMDLDDNPSAQQLYWSVRDFYRKANRFAQESREWWEPTATLRNQARQLVSEASRIDDLMYEANTPDSVMNEWSEVDNSVESLAGIYNFPYERERGLARRDYDDEGY